MEEMGTPGMDEFTVTYEKPKKAVLQEGEWTSAGNFHFKVDRINPETKSVKCSLTDGEGNIVAEKTFGPLDDDLLNTFPQYAPSQDRITMKYGGCLLPRRALHPIFFS